MKTYSPGYKILILCCILLCNVVVFAQIPKKAVASLPEFKQVLLKSRLERAVGKQMLSTMPPLLPRIITRHGVQRVILPRANLIDQIHFLEKQNFPIVRIHQYVAELESCMDNKENFFELLAVTYYRNHFKAFTPNLDQFFKKVASLNDPVLEQRVLNRMQQLVQYRGQIAEHFPMLDTDHAIRVRYANDIPTLTAENFEEEDLLLSVEQNLNATTKKTLYRHIRGNSTFSVGKTQKQTFRIHNYDGPTEYLPILYRYLVNGEDSQMDMYLVHDTDTKTMLLYNYDLSAWMRISPHEYKDVDHLHIHIHKRVRTEITVNNRPQIEPILINISIPVSSSFSNFALSEEELYNLFVLKPIQQMKSNNHIHMIIR